MLCEDGFAIVAPPFLLAKFLGASHCAAVLILAPGIENSSARFNFALPNVVEFRTLNHPTEPREFEVNPTVIDYKMTRNRNMRLNERGTMRTINFMPKQSVERVMRYRKLLIVFGNKRYQ